MVSMGTQNKAPFLSLYLEFIYKRLRSTIWKSLGTRLLLEAMQFSHHIQAKNRATYAGSRDRFGAHRETLPQPTRISPKEMEERRKKDYALVVIKNGQKGINVKKQNCSPWRIMMKRKWRHLYKGMRKKL
jgi:hypothetical protein